MELRSTAKSWLYHPVRASQGYLPPGDSWFIPVFKARILYNYLGTAVALIDERFSQAGSSMKIRQGLMVVLALLVGGAAVAGAAAAYYWHRATALPTWYTSSAADSDLATTVNSGGNLLQHKLATGDSIQYLDHHEVEIILTETELNQLIQAELSQSSTVAPLIEASQGVRATIDGERLQAGVVINPTQIPLDGLPADTQDSVKEAIAALPLLGDRDLYLGITGSPRVENGRLILADDTRIQVGNVKLSLAEVARLTGLSTDQLTEEINIALPQAGITLEGLEFVDGQVVLRGRKE